ncbi:MAG: hypothetical protein P1U61_04240 [Legionellaceae bacterium]|nr:hypothetical protein [Legionellaceae bacterium]
MSKSKSNMEHFLEKINCKKVDSFYLPSTHPIAEHSFFSQALPTHTAHTPSEEQLYVGDLRNIILEAIHAYHHHYSFATKAHQLASLLRTCHSGQTILNTLGDFLNKHATHGRETHHPLVACFVSQLFLSERQDILSHLTILIRAQAKQNQQKQWETFTFPCHLVNNNHQKTLENLTHIFKLFSTINTQEKEGYLMVELNG